MAQYVFWTNKYNGVEKQGSEMFEPTDPSKLIVIYETKAKKHFFIKRMFLK